VGVSIAGAGVPWFSASASADKLLARAEPVHIEPAERAPIVGRSAFVGKILEAGVKLVK